MCRYINYNGYLLTRKTKNNEKPPNDLFSHQIRRHETRPRRDIQDKTVGRITIEIIAMQPLRPQESQPLIEFQRGKIIRLGLQSNLQR